MCGVGFACMFVCTVYTNTYFYVLRKHLFFWAGGRGFAVQLGFGSIGLGVSGEGLYKDLTRLGRAEVVKFDVLVRCFWIRLGSYDMSDALGQSRPLR